MSTSPITLSTCCLIGAVLPLRRAPSTVISALASRELHPLLDRVGREAAEDDVVRRADPRAGQHRHDDLGDHRQVDPDDVALLDAQVLQRVGELLDVAVQVGVGDVALLALLAAPVVGDLVALARLDVAVQAVVGGVDLAVLEPLVERRIGVVDVVGGLLEPVQLLGLLDPPALPVLLGLVVDRRVAQQRVFAEVLRRVELLDLSSISSSCCSSVALACRRCRVCHKASPCQSLASRAPGSAAGAGSGCRRPGWPRRARLFCCLVVPHSAGR